MFARAKVLGVICLFLVVTLLALFFASAMDVISFGKFGDSNELEGRIKLVAGDGVDIATNLTSNSLELSLPATITRDIEWDTVEKIEIRAGEDLIIEGEVIGDVSPADGTFTKVTINAGASSGSLVQINTTASAGYLTLTAGTRTVRFGADGNIGPHFGSTTRGGILFPDKNDILPMIGLVLNDKGVNIGRSGYNFGTIYAKNAIFNEDGDDVDFLIEASGQPNAFFVQGSSGNVGIGTTNPNEKLEVAGNIFLTDNNKLIYGTGKDAYIYYDATNLIIDPNVVGTGKVLIGMIGDDDLMYGMLTMSDDLHVIADDGVGASLPDYVLTPTTSYVEIVNHDPDGANIMMSEVGISKGTEVLIVNTSVNISNFPDTVGVTELAGSFAMGQFDSLKLIYVGDRWVEVSRSDN